MAAAVQGRSVRRSSYIARKRAAHLVGVVHRDVKPANVLARADGIVLLTFWDGMTAWARLGLGPKLVE